VRSGTVKRLIYTASVVAASPLKEDGSDFKDVMDETCWTPLHDSLEYLFLDVPLYKVSSQHFILQFCFEERISIRTSPCSHLHFNIKAKKQRALQKLR